MNEAVGFAAGLLIVQPFLWFRYFHLAHHRHTNDPRRDPELAEGGKAKTWPQLLLVLSTLGYWRAKLRVLFANAVDAEPAPYVPVSARPKLVREARGMLALYALALGFSLTVSPVLLWVWLIPLALGLPLLRLYHLAEHGLCPQVDNLFLNTRTVLTNAPMRFLTWNMPYHAEHHILPTVPFYRLAALHRLTAPDLGVTAPGYRAFGRTYLRTLRRGSSVF
ncbi:MAG: fatty acid desaturase [Pseudomonadota bacterium]